MSTNEHPTWPKPPGTNEPASDDQDLETPDVAEPEVDELTRVTAERDDYLDQLQRSRAEFVNFKRRNEQERSQLRQFVARDVTSQFLPVIDDFERAMPLAPDDEATASFVQGIAMIQTKLTGIAERLGVHRIEAIGQPFDPSVHEAVATEPGTDGSTVVEVYQQGYRIGDVLVRPAMVKTGDPLPNNDDTPFDA